MIHEKRCEATIVTITALLASLLIVEAFCLKGTDERPEDQFEEDVDIQLAVMEYIKKNHPDAAVFIGEPSQMVWNKTSSEVKIGYSKYIYTSDGWKMTIGYATTTKLVYEVKAEFDEKIVWTGTVEDGVITETGYTSKTDVSGDINGDDLVNILDIAKAARAYGTRPGDDKWDVNADVNKDGEINILDISAIAREYVRTA